MKRLAFMFYFNCASCILHCAFSQNPLVKMWDKRFGGTVWDVLNSIQQTTDGGFILGGYSASGVNGDKTQATWGGSWDYWIVKTDSLGNKQWDKDFGGVQDDQLYSLHQTSDGGFILGGLSSSGIGGNKTQASWGYWDYWIVKTDSLGNKQWDRDYGGTGGDLLYSVQQTSDGGFILGGFSNSGIGGDKSQASWGIYDYWVVKTDSLGNKQWDKDFGGIDDERLHSIQQTSDGGFILGGYSLSGISGNKTQPSRGWYDYWIVKIDSLGTMQWDKGFGGIDDELLNSIQQTSEGGFILGGYSNSGISGDKTQANWGAGDYWIVKTDSLGNMQWDKDFGGTGGEDAFGNITQTADSGYLIAGTSYSDISGDKTENNSLGIEQTWILKTDTLGNKQWDKTALSPGHDEHGYAIETREGCYLIASWDDGNVGGLKSQWSQGGNDYWIVKLCDITFLPPTATAFTDSLLCPGTCANFTNLSFNAISYLWNFFGASPDTSTAINPTNICYATPGSYDVQLIASNANGSDTLLLTNYITVYPSPPPQSITQNGDTLFAIAGSASYQWYFNGNIINGATDYFYLAPASGDYNVVATDVNGCEVEAAIFNVIANILGTEDSGLWTVFPNPVEGKFTMHNSQCTIETALEVSVFNVMGEKMEIEIQSGTKNNSSYEIDVHALHAGLYYIEIVSSEKTFRSKFVKE